MKEKNDEWRGKFFAMKTDYDRYIGEMDEYFDTLEAKKQMRY